MTVFEARRELARALQQAAIDTAVSEADQLLASLLDMSRADLILNAQMHLSAQQAARLADWQARRVAREPLQHILGVAHFYGLELRVNPSVLIPRPETEVLVELVLQQLSGLQHPFVLDIGTGSGAIALAIKHHLPAARVLATDISAAALAVARQNAADLGLEVAFQLSDGLAAAAVQRFAQAATVVVANPPYLPEADRSHVSPEVQQDPAIALYAGEDGLAVFRRLEREVSTALPEGAYFFLELDPRNVQLAYSLTAHWQERSIYQDLLGRARFLQLKR